MPQTQSTVSGNKRAIPAIALAVLKNPQVQEAAIEKGVEVVGKLVDKQFENIERAQEKAAEFLKKEVPFACYIVQSSLDLALLTSNVKAR